MFDMYLQIDGVKGESTDDKHAGWIELLSFTHDMIQPVSSTKSSSGGGSTGRTQHSDFVISKFLDSSSPKLYEAVSNGKHFSKAKIEVCRAGGSQVKFFEISFEQLMISKVSLNSAVSSNVTIGSASTGGGGGKASLSDFSAGSPVSGDILPGESVSLNYGKIEWVYTAQKRADGSGGGSVNAKVDLTAGAKTS